MNYKGYSIQQTSKGFEIYSSHESWLHCDEPVHCASSLGEAKSWIDGEHTTENFDPGKYKDIETLYRGMEDLTYGDALKWVEFWYPHTMSKGGMRFTATTILAVYNMWREDLVKVEGNSVIMK